jgi:hypothetical protein
MERVLAESMPIVATGKFHLLDMVVLLRLVAQSEHHSLEGREHGRTITLAEVQDRMWERQGCAVSGHLLNLDRTVSFEPLRTLDGSCVPPVPSQARRVRRPQVHRGG